MNFMGGADISNLEYAAMSSILVAVDGDALDTRRNAGFLVGLPVIVLTGRRLFYVKNMLIHA